MSYQPLLLGVAVLVASCGSPSAAWRATTGTTPTSSTSTTTTTSAPDAARGAERAGPGVGVETDPGPVSTAVPDSIKECESDGDYSAVSSSGYYGAWQFSVGTWQSVGGVGLPHHASAAEQDHRAALLWDGGAGAGHWPSCA